MKRIPALAALALAGLIGGHGAIYFLLEPHSEDRATLLGASGHHYSDLIFPLFIAMAVMGVAFGLLWGLKDRAAPARSNHWRVLAAIQSFGFVTLEICERLISHGSFHSFAQIFAVGLLVQLPIAWVGARLLLAVRKLGRILASAFARPSTKTAQVRWERPKDLQFKSATHERCFARGPPVFLTQAV